jgi:membrane-bound lytic murein transglycosylase D
MKRVFLSLLVLAARPARAVDHVEAPVATPVATAPSVQGGDPSSDAPDDVAIEQKVREESAALEDLHDAEQKAHLLDDLSPGNEAAAAASRLGWESPLRQRLGDAFRREPGSTRDAGGAIAGLPEIDHDLARLQAEYDIPIEVNEAVVAYVRFFQSPRVRPHFVKWLGRSSRYIPRYREILKEEGLPEDTVYLAMIESGFANLAASKAKAVGPWQFIGATGKRFGLGQDFWLDERRDPEKSARAAARYLKELHHQTGDWRLAWAGYNAGVGKIFKARRHGQLDFWTMTRGRILKPETKGYVPKLMAAAIVSKHAEAFGFSREEIEAQSWREYEEVVVPRATELSFVAEAAGVPEQALLELNPELRRTCTPPKAYALKLPKGRGEAFAATWPQIADRAAKHGVARHRVMKGETLAAIAKEYGVEHTTLAKLNGVRPGRRVKQGSVLAVPLGALARQDAEALAAQLPRPQIEEPVRVVRLHGKKAGKKQAALAQASAPKRAKQQPQSILRASVKVRSGETLWSVAKRLGVEVNQLARWNGIRNPNRHTLRAGQKLYIAPRATAASPAGGGTRGAVASAAP